MDQRIVPADLAHVIETMRSWLAGEPVWPYAKIIETWGPEFEMYRRRWARQYREKMKQAEETGMVTFERDAMTTVMRGVSIYHLRDVYIEEFGFAIPSKELLDELAKHGPIVEVGAGTGYMTRLMENRGIHVMGSDIEYPGPNSYRFQTGRYDRLQRCGVQAKTMARRYRDRTIFCSWPTLEHTWFRQMLRAMSIGQKLIVIREDACAEDSAWQYLDDCFEDLGMIDIPTFEHMNDYAQVAVKKRQRARNDDGTTMQP